mmetsp:Transcript_35454/g.39219  ORF Transcript_35454/g.39219 Transcript_35454/m.39219 type:complete len:192 (-) Transcript_35454:176-751(-)
MKENILKKSFNDGHDRVHNGINNRINTPPHLRSNCITSKKQRQTIAFERRKQLYKARIRNKLKETRIGRELLLGRSIFKQQQNNDKKRHYFGNLEGSNHNMQQDDSNYYVQKYLENRAVRRLVRMRKQIKFTLLVNDNTTTAGLVVFPILVQQPPVLVKSEYDVVQDTQHSPSPDETLSNPIPDENFSIMK